MTSGAAPVYPLPTSHGNCIIDALLNGVISQNPEAHKHDVMHNMENPSVPVEGYSFSMSPALMMLDFDPSTLLSAINSGTVATPAVYCEPELITARPSRDEDSQLQAIHNPSRDFVQGDCSSHDNISLEKLNPAMELGLIRTTSDSALSTAADSDQDSFNAGYSQLQNGYAGLPSFPILKHTSSLGYREGPGHGHLQTASYNLVVPPDCTMEENITTTKSSIHNTSGLLPHGFNVPESLGINDLVESREPQSPGPMISGLSSGNNWSSLRAAAGNNIYNEDTSGRTNALREMIYRLSAMQPVNIDLNSITRPKRRNVRISKDPQSVAARHRRERISDRIRILQRLVPGGTKMDTASMLDEAIHYVKFLKRQVQALESTNNKLDPWLINRLGAALSHNTNTDTNNANPNSDTKFTTSCSPLNPNLAASSSTGNSTKTCDLHRAYNSFKQSSI